MANTVRRRLQQWLRGLLGITSLEVRLKCEQDDTRRVLKAIREIGKRLGRLELENEQRQRVLARQYKEIRLRSYDVDKHLGGLRTQLGARGVQAQLRSLRRDTRDLLRRLVLDPNSLDYPYRLSAQRCSLGSQRGEDGISWAIFQHAGIETHRFIDIGCGSEGGAAGFYARECGWQGLMIDVNAEHLASVRARFSRAQITAVNACVTRENVNDLVQQAGFAEEVDLLSIDIDGMDYWVWDALSVVEPRLVILEYNALFGLDHAVTVPYDATFDRARLSGVLRKRYFGASLPAFVRLGREKGYRLVAVEPMALNAVFLREDVGSDIPECSLEALPYSEIKTNRFEDIFRLIQENGLSLVELDREQS